MMARERVYPEVPIAASACSRQCVMFHLPVHRRGGREVIPCLPPRAGAPEQSAETDTAVGDKGRMRSFPGQAPGPRMSSGAR